MVGYFSVMIADQNSYSEYNGWYSLIIVWVLSGLNLKRENCDRGFFSGTISLGYIVYLCLAPKPIGLGYHH